MTRRKGRQLGLPRGVSIPKYGYREQETEIYEGVKWLLQVPNTDPFDLLSIPSPSEIVEGLKLEGPLCPKCETEFEERKKLFGYTRICVKCGFRVRSKISIYESQKKAYLYFRSVIRKRLRKQTKKEV